MPGVERQVVVVRRLRLVPHVERLVQHDEAHAVGQVQQFRRRRIVARADRIGAHLAQQFQLPFERAHVDRRAERAQVVVQAHALQRHALPVQQEAARRIEDGGAEAERRLDHVRDLAVVRDRGDGHVALRPGDAPQARPRHGQRLRQLDLPAGRRLRDRGSRPARDRRRAPLAVRVQHVDLGRDLHLRRPFRGVDGRLHGHRRRCRRHLRRRHVRAVLRDVHGRRLDEPDVAVDAAARIPARRLRRVVEPDRDDVVRARPGVRRQVHAPRCVAVRPAAHVMAVDPDRGVRHGAVDVQEQLAARVGRRQREVLAVPAHAPPRQLARLARRGQVERSLDAPVVRQVELAPRGIVEARLRGRHVAGAGGVGRGAAGRVALGEAPVGVEGKTFANVRVRGLRGAAQQRDAERNESEGTWDERHDRYRNGNLQYGAGVRRSAIRNVRAAMPKRHSRRDVLTPCANTVRAAAARRPACRGSRRTPCTRCGSGGDPSD